MALAPRLVAPEWGWLDLFLLSVATLRLAYMLSSEAGPWGMFERLRARLGGLTACLYCASVWVALLLAIVYHFVPIVIWLFAMSGLALALRSYTGFGRGES